MAEGRQAKWFDKIGHVRKGYSGFNPINQVLKIITDFDKKKKRKNERIMQILVATTSALARTPCMRTHYVLTKIEENQPCSIFLFNYNSRGW